MVKIGNMEIDPDKIKEQTTARQNALAKLPKPDRLLVAVANPFWSCDEWDLPGGLILQLWSDKVTGAVRHKLENNMLDPQRERVTWDLVEDMFHLLMKIKEATK